MHIAPRPFSKLCRRWRRYSMFPPIGYGHFIFGMPYRQMPRRMHGELDKVFATWR